MPDAKASSDVPEARPSSASINSRLSATPTVDVLYSMSSSVTCTNRPEPPITLPSAV